MRGPLPLGIGRNPISRIGVSGGYISSHWHEARLSVGRMNGGKTIRQLDKWKETYPSAG